MTTPPPRYDAIIVGAGIAGSALATVLARAGRSVLLLEKTTVHRDRVRGEWLAPWGVAELQALGLYDAFIAAGAHHLAKHIGYGDHTAPEDAEANALPLQLVPGVPGPLCIGHPAACDLLNTLARDAGVTLLRDVEAVSVSAGDAPSVRYTLDGGEHDAACRLVVGADGRGSAVRRQLGIELHEDPQHHWMGGMLVEDAHGWPDDTQGIGAEGDVHFLVFPQGNGRIRLYLGYATGQPARLAGEGGPRAFLEAFRLKSAPLSDHIAGATPAGPVHSYPNQDAWTDTPYVRGAVLIGDAAGYNDPIIGQGLSISYRDVRLVRDILLAEDDWSRPEIFAPYADERRERMRRLRFAAALQSRIENEFGPEAEARRARVFERWAADPSLQLPLLGTLMGPEKLPATAYDDALRERLLA
jgi:2-polyprenyl-6-methoxyphenol hydroxylase-like FAD-dependent oxidoreductase